MCLMISSFLFSKDCMRSLNSSNSLERSTFFLFLLAFEVALGYFFIVIFWLYCID
jgi:hypothetical protein